MAKISLQKVNIVGEKFFHKFEMEDSSIVEVETTEQDYRQLGQPNPTNPTIKGGKWLHSFSRFKFDTPDGDLGDNQYHDNGGSYFMKRGDKFYTLDKTELISDKVDQKVLDTAIEGISEKLTKK